jgi:toxin HigB-1
VIKTFKDKRTKQFYEGERVNAFDSFRRQAEKKLDQLDAAFVLGDLHLPGNHLEALQRNRKGQHSVRINDKWRICFEWPKGADGPMNVEIVDYH